MLVERPIRAVDPVALARASGMGRMGRVLAIPDIPRPTLISQQLSGGMGACACHGPSLNYYAIENGTGQNNGNYSVMGAVQTGLNFIPVIGPIISGAFFSGLITSFQSWLGIGAGRVEADLIVPKQNELVTKLDAVTAQFLVGRSPTLGELDSMYRNVWQLAVGFMEFVDMRDFTDRRASGQALNTIMPYIDGTCGYPVPLPLRIPYPAQANCLSWGDGTLGGVGTNGMLGALKRAIQAAGGTPPTLPSIVDSANDGIRVEGGNVYSGTPETSGFGMMGIGLIGVLAIFMLSRKRVF
jgi:hypothetical protein